jgi:uncharacterized membrane protein YqiK
LPEVKEMQTSVILFFSSIAMVLFLAIGIMVGWFANMYRSQPQRLAYHPEFYNADGKLMDEELLTVRFVHDELEEDEYYD